MTQVLFLVLDQQSFDSLALIVLPIKKLNLHSVILCKLSGSREINSWSIKTMADSTHNVVVPLTKKRESARERKRERAREKESEWELCCITNPVPAICSTHLYINT